MSTPPFTAQGEAAVCARVAIAYLKRVNRQYDDHQVKPLILIGIAVQSLAGLQFTTLRSCLLSLSVWVETARQSKDWLRGVIYRDMMGYTLRRCLSESYKAHRRDPRVTNRGVTRRALATQTAETAYPLAYFDQAQPDD